MVACQWKRSSPTGPAEQFAGGSRPVLMDGKGGGGDESLGERGLGRGRGTYQHGTTWTTSLDGYMPTHTVHATLLSLSLSTHTHTHTHTHEPAMHQRRAGVGAHPLGDHARPPPLPSIPRRPHPTHPIPIHPMPHLLMSCSSLFTLFNAMVSVLCVCVVWLLCVCVWVGWVDEHLQKKKGGGGDGTTKVPTLPPTDPAPLPRPGVPHWTLARACSRARAHRAARPTHHDTGPKGRRSGRKQKRWRCGV